MTGYYRWDLERYEWRAWVMCMGVEVDCRQFKHRQLLNDYLMDRGFVSWTRV